MTAPATTSPGAVVGASKKGPAARVLGPASRLVRSLSRFATSPLTVAQVLTSATGALGMVVAAWAMQPEQFRVFALLTLAANLLTGLFRAALFQPALMNQRVAKHSWVVLRHGVAAAACSSVLTGAVALALGIRGVTPLLLVAGSAALPTLYDWLRFRAIGSDRRWDLAVADGTRLVLTVLALLLPAVRVDAVLLQTSLCAVTVVPLALLALRVPHVSTWQPYRSYAGSARWQTVDYVFSSSLNSLPLLVLGGLSGALLVPAMRLAQSLLGPLTLAFAAAATNLVADGSTRAEYAHDRAVVDRGSRLARRLALLALACVGVLAGGLQLTGLSFTSVSNTDLVLALVLTGASLASVAWSNMHAIVMRVLGKQASVTVGRSVVCGLTLAGFVVGFVVAGVTGSIVIGFVVLTIAGPVVYARVARRAYASLGAR